MNTMPAPAEVLPAGHKPTEPEASRAGARRLPNGRFPPRPEGGPAKGVGWGGPANGRQAPAIADGYRPPPENISAGIANAEALREHLRPHTRAAADKWVSLLDDPNPFAAGSAADKIVERVFGKPREPEPAPPPRRYDLSRLTLAQQRTFLAMLEKVTVTAEAAQVIDEEAEKGGT